MTLRLADLARRDLEDIRRYTVETWGRDQWLRYYRGMAETFRRIADHPDHDRDRSLFVKGMRSATYRSHIVFYIRLAAAGDAVVILRILHQNRNLPALIYYEDLDGA
ncbi:MAG: type II toxin-antitoxin system RelE/ParE family toxin [Mangrovicoccus sp.]|nr:type II toxin-antitoxin system RelE/ParE family toxin [Mangrovicoccus sp.]